MKGHTGHINWHVEILSKMFTMQVFSALSVKKKVFIGNPGFNEGNVRYINIYISI